MRLLADACVAGSLVRALRAAGHDVVYAAEGPPGIDDLTVLQAAFDQRRLLLTEDHDFGTLAIRDGHSSVGVILIELYGLSAIARDQRVLAVLHANELELPGNFTVIEPSRARSRPLEPGS